MAIPSNLPKKSYIKAMWSLDGDSKDRVDSHDGTDTNITYGTSYGKIGQGASFNGSTSKIVIADHSDLKPTGAFTISAWFKTSSTSSYKVIFASFSLNTKVAGIELLIYNNNKLSALSGKNTGTTSGTDYKEIIGGTTVTDGNWRHAVFAWDTTKLYLYLNGASDTSPVDWTYSPAYAATNYVRIGSRSQAGTDEYFFNGSLDEVILWNGVCLNSTEVSILYNISKYRFGEGFFNFF